MSSMLTEAKYKNLQKAVAVSKGITQGQTIITIQFESEDPPMVLRLTVEQAEALLYGETAERLKAIQQIATSRTLACLANLYESMDYKSIHYGKSVVAGIVDVASTLEQKMGSAIKRLEHEATVRGS